LLNCIDIWWNSYFEIVMKNILIVLKDRN